MGGSPFGTTFFLPVALGATSGNNRHFRIRRHSLNWRAEAVVQCLQLVEFSIRNVVGALRCLSGEPPGTVKFSRPADPAAFDAAWVWDVGVSSSDLDTVVDPGHIVPLTKADLVQELEARSGHGAA